jgi:outer membrane protein TolC
MVRLSTILILLFGCCFTSSAQVLTLDSCITAAYQNFSFAQQLELSNEITETNKKRIGKNYLPSLDLNAIGTYQNEQITIPVEIPIPGFEAPAAPLNLNSALFSLRQWIYDGSQTHYQKLMEDANGRIQSQELAVQQLELKTMVMQQYFAALLKEKQADILAEKETALEKIVQLNKGGGKK